jgi:hypothetical protein
MPNVPPAPLASSPACSRRGFLRGASAATALATLSAVTTLGGCARGTGARVALAPSEPRWEPARTFAFFVGLVEFENPSVYEAFDVPDRKDRELFERLIARGVPPSQAVFLDHRDAARASIESQLSKLLARTRPGDLIWVHYSGHGTRGDDGQGYFAPWDGDDDLASLWSVRSIVDAIEREHRGEHAILSADCCHAGSLAREASARAAKGARVGYGCLASSLARSSSTGAWTFTECLLDAVSGAPELDLDGDGALRFDEIGRYAEAELAFVDGQLTQSTTTGSFPARLTMAARDAKGRTRERVEVRSADGSGDDDEETWVRAHVLAREPGRVRVQLVPDEDDEDDEASAKAEPTPRWVEPTEVRAWTPTTYARGTRVDVEVEEEDGDEKPEKPEESEKPDDDGGTETTRAARVLDARLGVHLVRYEDDDEGSEDEWVPSWRLSARE